MVGGRGESSLEMHSLIGGDLKKETRKRCVLTVHFDCSMLSQESKALCWLGC